MTDKTTTTVPLNALKPGHDKSAPHGGINVRIHNRKADLAALAASIKSHGVINAVVVIPDPAATAKKPAWFVVDGNRRLAALQSLAKSGDVAKDYAVPVVETTEASARELGLAANVMRTALHPADSYTAFAALAREGLTAEEIAGRFGIEAKAVRQLLAIGDLSPKVLDAWRAGKLGDQAAMKIVAEFTLARDLAEQDEVLAKLDLGRGGYLYEGVVKRHLGVDSHGLKSRLTLVGRDAYADAGGRLVEDLFGDAVRILDTDLLKQLADDKIGAACKQLVAEGWSWAVSGDSLPMHEQWQWKRIDPETFGSEAEARAATGVIVSLHYDGTLAMREYVVRPEVVEIEEDEVEGGERGAAVVPIRAAEPGQPKSKLSGALVGRLAEQTTRALQEAITTQPKAGLAALLAGSLCDRYPEAPVRVRVEGRATVALNDRFEVLLERYMAMSVDELLSVAGQAAARALDVGHAAPAGSKAVMALAGAIDAGELTDALGRTWDAEDFFKSVPKAVLLEAVAEALGPEEARKIKSKPKADLVAFAVASVVPTGWLPEEIRHPGYVGPGSRQPADEKADA